MCTRVLWNDNACAVVVSRTMDWPTSTDPRLVVMPRGLEHNGGDLGGQSLADPNPFEWRSTYGSLVTTIYGIGCADGMNERGLAAHMLYLSACDFGERDPSRPGLHAGLWAQYFLDQAATVAEALDLLTSVQITLIEARGSKATVHLALEDSSGDSAIIEFIDGEAVVHHGREFQIMTNDPTYDEQLALLAELDFSHPSREMPLPGNVNARDRFQRMAYYRALLPEPKNEREAIAGVLALARNASVPFGAPYGEFGIYNTEYRTVSDVTNRRYFFELTTAPNVIWVEFDQLDVSEGAPVLGLDPDDVSLSGEVSARLSSTPQPY